MKLKDHEIEKLRKQLSAMKELNLKLSRDAKNL